MINKENAWKIIRRKCTLPEAMRMSGETKKFIDEKLKSIKEIDTQDACMYQAVCFGYTKSAYNYLVKIGEIDKNKILNLAGDTDSEGDIGVKGKLNYRFTKGKWEKW